MTTKTKRVCNGVYIVTIGEYKFAIERISAISDHEKDHTWQLCQFDKYGNTEYWQHFRTKREAKQAIVNWYKNS